MLGFTVPMTPTTTTGRTDTDDRPRIGVPWRTSQEERDGTRQKLDYYFAAVRKAGAEPVEVSLRQPANQLQEQVAGLDGFVLPGSPADVDPVRYGADKHQKTNELDDCRDSTDLAILDHAFQASKPVLAICYGCQILNVYRKGTLVQDIPSERPKSGKHGHTDLPPGETRPDAEHTATFAAGSRLASLNQAAEAIINTSHHQAIDQPGSDLRVTVKAEDGTIEGVEWTGDSNWVVGVQWHPERMVGDAFSERLFTDFVAAVRTAREARDVSRGVHGGVVQKA
jgi:putative glutamine amidotransferase